MTQQHCTECIHFSNETKEDYFDGGYHIWTEISCDMGNDIDDLAYPIVPFDTPCKDYMEKHLR